MKSEVKEIHMTVQVPDQPQYSRRRRSRQILAGLVVVFLVGVAAVWVANMGSALAGMLGIVCALLGIFLALLERLRLQHEVQMPARSVVASERGQPFYEQIEGLMLAVDKHKG